MSDLSSTLLLSRLLRKTFISSFHSPLKYTHTTLNNNKQQSLKALKPKPGIETTFKKVVALANKKR